LAKIDGVLVISRNSAFTYKGKDVKIKDVAKELSVRYVLEGSVQRAGNRLRIRAQLIDGKTDHHVWAESYDGDGTMDNIFELQDEITGKIVAALMVKLSPSEQVNIIEKGTESIEAYDAYLKGESHRRSFTPDDYVKAVKYYKKAIQLDPNFSEAYASLAYTYWWTWAGGKDFWDKLNTEYIDTRLLARHYLKKAMRHPTSIGYRLNAYMEVYKRNYQKAIYYAEEALTISPNEADAMKDIGTILIFADKPEVAMKYLKQAAVLDPANTNIAEIGAAYFLMSDYENSVKFVELGLAQHSKYKPWWAYSAASHAFLGNSIEAEKALEKWKTCFADDSYRDAQALYYAYPLKNSAVFERLIKGLKLAGNKFRSTKYFKISKENKLTGREIKELLFGRTEVGNNWGTLYRTQRNLNGDIISFTLDALNYSDTGRTWIQDDMFCDKFNKDQYGLEDCGYVYKNPEGDSEHRNEYLAITEYYFLWFSVE
jgi:adenylate cyclase